MKRYLSVWFPDWPLDRLRRARRQGNPSSAAGPARPKPFALYEASAGGLTLVAANAPAQAAGVAAGLRLTDARAILPALACEEWDSGADAAALAALAGWMVRFSPLVALDGADGLMLDITGCAHLFGGEAGMAAEMSARLKRAGYGHRIAVAGTPGAAHALAREAGPGAPPVLASGEEAEGLAHLPMQALRLSPDALTLLRRFGLTRIGQLYGIDRKALARRFRSKGAADAVCLRLDQALGRRHEPLSPVRPPADYIERLACPEPLSAAEGVSEGLARLAGALCEGLSQAGLGAQTFIFRAYRSDGGVAAVSVNAAAPVRSAAHVLRLFREKIAAIDPGFGIDLLTLEAERTGPMETGSRPLSGDMAGTDFDAAAIAALADRITARLGEGRVTVMVAEARHLPEKAERRAAFAGEAPRQMEGPLPGGPRPVRMLARAEAVSVVAQVPDGPPLQFIWRRRLRKVVRADGPERIAPEWWTSLPPPPGERAVLPRARDYYRIEDSEGHRYWVFREGLYGDGRGAQPEWFVQGLFA
ncbi:Y-family DNA polymerase [Hyphomonas sp.]|uniref:Y-family DNA polymerase n=1 Tax=Hyphomonas sp. TaxID=87 RepID=UPI00391A2908